MSSKLKREHEKAFFEELGDLNIFRREVITSKETFAAIADGIDSIKSEQFLKFNDEILDNVMQLTDTTSRIAYYKRIFINAEKLEKRFSEEKNVITSSKGSTIELLPVYPNTMWEYNATKDEVLKFYDCCINHVSTLKQTIAHYINAESEVISAAEIASNITKIFWKGTPQEFGAIMKKLLDQGYMPSIKSIKNTVIILHNHFLILDAKGKEVTIENLYKCFTERYKPYFPDEFKLIQSDNYGKD